VHSIIDDCSRLAYTEIHDDQTAVTVTAFTERALDFFLDHGVVAERLMTDNAFAYIHNRTLRELLDRRAIRHLRTRPYTPRTNGKVERYQQTLQREWAYALEYASSHARRASLPHWVRHYNERRTHSALGNHSVFCCALNFRYLRFSLIDPLDRLSGPSSLGTPDGPRRLRWLARYHKSNQNLSTPARGPRQFAQGCTL
jgi:transposase InsO family protein